MSYINKVLHKGFKILTISVSPYHQAIQPICSTGTHNHNRNIYKSCTYVSKYCFTQNSIRKICTSPLTKRGNRGFYEPYKRPDAPLTDPTLKDLKDGFRQIKTEIIKWKEEFKEKFEQDIIIVRPGDTDIVFHFQTEEDLKEWIVSDDGDYSGQGFSYGSLTLSPPGKGLFTGKTDLRVKDDGKAHFAGFVNITNVQKTRSFLREKNFDWMPYTHLVMRVRGDGRRYLINLLTPGAFDITWFNMYNYVLYTRGGPYWQDVKIPFSKFFYNAQGRTQDTQMPLVRNRIQRIGITAGDNVHGPFRLEIDYIGVHYDPTHTEEFAYETYTIPPFII